MPHLINDGLPFRHDQCGELGLTEHELRRARRELRVRRLFPRVYVDASVPVSRWLRLNAAKVITPEHAVVSDCLAAWVLGIDTFRPSERHTMIPTLLVPHGSSRVRLPGVKCRQAILDSGDVVQIDDLLLTSPVRTTSDLLRTLWRPYALAAGDGMVRAGVVDKQAVVAYVDRLRRFRGSPQARELAPLIDPMAETAGESWQRLRMIDAGFPIPECQIHVVDEFGRDRYFDMGYRELLIASEYDGREFHTTNEDRAHDGVRRSYFEDRYGWRFALGRREVIFGDDPSFERQIGEWLGVEPNPRRW